MLHDKLDSESASLARCAETYKELVSGQGQYEVCYIYNIGMTATDTKRTIYAKKKSLSWKTIIQI